MPCHIPFHLSVSPLITSFSLQPSAFSQSFVALVNCFLAMPARLAGPQPAACLLQGGTNASQTTSVTLLALCCDDPPAGDVEAEESDEGDEGSEDEGEETLLPHVPLLDTLQPAWAGAAGAAAAGTEWGELQLTDNVIDTGANAADAGEDAGCCGLLVDHIASPVQRSSGLLGQWGLGWMLGSGTL
jgi:hypothetical protein